MSEETATTTTTTANTTGAADASSSSDAMEEAVAALESPEPLSDSAKASTPSGKEPETAGEKKPDASSSKEVVRAEAAALKARLRAERELRMAKQRAASIQPAPQQTQQQQTQQQPSTPEEDALVEVVRKAIGLQTGEKPDQKAVEEAVAKMVQQQLAMHAEEQRKQAAKLAVVSHLESARDKLPLLSAFADDRIDDVYEVLIDEYVNEYRANGRKLTVAEAADRVERKLSDAIARLAGLAAKQKQQEQPVVGTKQKRKMQASSDDDDPEVAMRDAIAALTSKEPRS